MKRNAEEVAEGLLALLKQWPDLVKAKLAREMDPGLEAPAVAVMLTIVETGELNAFRKAARPVQRMAATLTIDFMAKLMGPLAHVTWDVPETVQGPALARHVIAAEIRRAHPRLATRH